MTNWLAGQVSDLQLERIIGADGAALVDPLFREYGLWVADQLLAHHGLRFPEADLERHHTAFRGELPGLVGPRGRLLLARIGDEPVGVGTLKPVDAATGEIKRMYVRPTARGRGVGRALLERLVADARADGYVVVRLETLDFMKEAHTLYRSLGFIDTTVFEGSEAVAAGIDSYTHYLELRLPTAVGPG
jgi:GNAT superfamily N-acetyltransferase